MTRLPVRRILIALGALAVILAVAVAARAGWGWLTAPLPEFAQGEFEAAEIDVSTKVPGRVAEILVREGAHVRRGDALVHLRTPEIDAKLEQAEAALEAANAQRLKANRGAREEEVRQALAIWQRAESGAALAEKTAERVTRLERDGVVPTQRKDEAETNARAARQAADAARAVYDMALAGARVEDRQAAGALAARAGGAVDEVRAYLEETRLVAPIDGEVQRKLVDPGEVVGPGTPIVTLVDLTDVWAVFQVREDRLARLAKGTRFTTRVPALDRDIALEVFFIAPAGEFATWRATSAQGGFDVKTFEVRARPVAPVAGLRPGMTVLLAWDTVRAR